MYNAYEMSDCMMKCKVLMTRVSKNEATGITQHTFIGNIVNKENRLCFRYVETDSKAHCLVLYENDEVTIKRDGETRSNMHLIENQNCVAEIITPFGQMDVTVRANKIVRKSNSLHVSYSLVEGDDVIDNIDITWQFIKEDIN